jgi:hypothetical protein
MGHFLFICLHLGAVLFGLWGLVVTIPLHVIYVAVRSNSRPAASADEVPSPATHVRCPACAELVRKEARLCRHCQTKLIPQQ